MDDLSEIEQLVLTELLRESQEFGFLGPVRVEEHIEHSLRFVRILRELSHEPVAGDGAASDLRTEPSNPQTLRILDLGSGGGVPGLVVAVALPDAHVTLLDSNVRRCEFLRSAVERLSLDDRVSVLDDHVSVLEGRAEELARAASLRHTFQAVISRSFGPPAVVAECAAGFLALDGLILVSEPPDGSGDRWPPAALADLNLRVVGSHGSIQVLKSEAQCSDRFPRRTGIPAKRPLF